MKLNRSTDNRSRRAAGAWPCAGLVVAQILAIGGACRADAALRFNRDVRPILAEACFQCHGPDANQRQAGLRLDSRADATRELDSGVVAVAPGDPAASELVARITSTDDSLRMPPVDSGKTLTPAQVETLRTWVAEGAAYESHWSFIPPERPPSPPVARASWPRNEVDRFVLAALEADGLAPSPEAERRVLLRRVTFDLTGLPPTAEDVEAFVADPAPDAYEQAVDRLLASPRFGERMAAIWLDLARYADSDGYEKDSHRQMWPYRDWVIGAFNANMPFDRFTIEQLAGDQLPQPTRAQLIATAFNRNGPTTSESGSDPAEYVAKYAVDRVTTTSTVWLGLTMQCAECHDHKYDPLTTRDFYRLFAFFDQVPGDPLYEGADSPPSIRLYDDAQQAESDRLEKRLAELQAQQPPAADVAAELADVEAQLKRLRDQAPAVRIMSDAPQRVPTHVLQRGDYRSPGEAVLPGIPVALGGTNDMGAPSRLALARWIVSDENPLTARVTVNRLWAMMFGRGLVGTVDDFGAQGQWPTHPDLLDWLAVEFRAQGWDVKAIVRLLATSATYRQASHAAAEAFRRDPDNRQLARGPRRRLSAEMIRDNALAVSGLLEERVGGPSVFPYHPAGLWEEMAWADSPWKSWPQDHGANLYRRGLYTFWKRSVLHPALSLFDAAPRTVCAYVRPTTNTPLQAYVTLNETSYVEAARRLAERVLVAPGGGDPLERMYRAVLARPPEPSERAELTALVAAMERRYRDDPSAAAALLAIGESPRDASVDAARLAAWTAASQVVLNLDETLNTE